VKKIQLGHGEDAFVFTQHIRPESQELAMAPFDPKTFEIGSQTSVEEAENDHLVQTKVVPAPVPFGYLHDDWVKMRQQIQDGDELKYFRSDFGNGLALVRSGNVVYWIGCGIPSYKKW
jgi:hypothetical protein